MNNLPAVSKHPSQLSTPATRSDQAKPNGIINTATDMFKNIQAFLKTVACFIVEHPNLAMTMMLMLLITSSQAQDTDTSACVLADDYFFRSGNAGFNSTDFCLGQASSNSAIRPLVNGTDAITLDTAVTALTLFRDSVMVLSRNAELATCCAAVAFNLMNIITTTATTMSTLGSTLPALPESTSPLLPESTLPALTTGTPDGENDGVDDTPPQNSNSNSTTPTPRPGNGSGSGSGSSDDLNITPTPAPTTPELNDDAPQVNASTPEPIDDDMPGDSPQVNSSRPESTEDDLSGDGPETTPTPGSGSGSGNGSAPDSGNGSAPVPGNGSAPVPGNGSAPDSGSDSDPFVDFDDSGEGIDDSGEGIDDSGSGEEPITDESRSSESSNTAGIVLGCLAGLAALGTATVVGVKKWRKYQSTGTSTSEVRNRYGHDEATVTEYTNRRGNRVVRAVNSTHGGVEITVGSSADMPMMISEV